MSTARDTKQSTHQAQSIYPMAMGKIPRLGHKAPRWLKRLLRRALLGPIRSVVDAQSLSKLLLQLVNPRDQPVDIGRRRSGRRPGLGAENGRRRVHAEGADFRCVWVLGIRPRFSRLEASQRRLSSALSSHHGVHLLGPPGRDVIRRIGAAGDVGLDAVGAGLRAVAADLALPALLARQRRTAALLLDHRRRHGGPGSFGLRF